MHPREHELQLEAQFLETNRTIFSRQNTIPSGKSARIRFGIVARN